MPNWLHDNLLTRWRLRGQAKFIRTLEGEMLEDLRAARQGMASKVTVEDIQSKYRYDEKALNEWY